MTTHPEKEKPTLESKLLTQLEQSICEQITTLEAPHNQRAKALLALNEHSTQAQAAEQSGLTAGQVKYWVAKFRKLRLGIFPDALLEKRDDEVEDTGIEQAAGIEEKPAAVESQKSVTKKTKSAKVQKRKKSKKKTGKVEKGKKDKKTKKSKKKPRKAKKDKQNNKPKKIKQKTKKTKPKNRAKKSKKRKK